MRYIDCNDSNQALGVRESLWEDFDTYPNMLHPAVAEISDMKVDLGRLKLAIQYT